MLLIRLERQNMINEHKLQKKPEVLALIRSEFEPGEVGIALCLVELEVDYTKSLADSSQPNTSLHYFLVLTNRYIRLMGFKQDWKGNTKKAPVLNSAITRRAINNIKTVEGSAFDRRLKFSFSWEGKQERFFMPPIEGKAFVDKFREVMSKQDSNTAQVGMAEELQKLTQLTKEGILSAEEFDRAKNQLIGASSSQVDEATKLLRQLHELLVQGVLSESEFNMKKWDVLSHRLIPKDKPS